MAAQSRRPLTRCTLVAAANLPHRSVWKNRQARQDAIDEIQEKLGVLGALCVLCGEKKLRESLAMGALRQRVSGSCLPCAREPGANGLFREYSRSDHGDAFHQRAAELG